MIRVVMFVRDMVIALALGWIGVTIQPAPPAEEACPVKGVDSVAAICTNGARAPSFDVAGFGMELSSSACPNG
ncbi:MAG: hypothetical protein NW200_10750 [Hyphomonadaceae bacterium]|nr:hypothetical protein [Hyphomonadaceae bacterium]